MEGVNNNTNQKFLRIFWDLAATNSKVQTRAAATLIRSLDFCQEKFGEEEFCPELAYSLQRLVAGVGSSTHSSRIGFSLALTEVWYLVMLSDFQLLSHFSLVTIEEVVEKILEEHAGDTKSKSETRDNSFGIIFGSLSILRSGRLKKLWEVGFVVILSHF
jgi:hypothetical protein